MPAIMALFLAKRARAMPSATARHYRPTGRPSASDILARVAVSASMLSWLGLTFLLLWR